MSYLYDIDWRIVTKPGFESYHCSAYANEMEPLRSWLLERSIECTGMMSSFRGHISYHFFIKFASMDEAALFKITWC